MSDGHIHEHFMNAFMNTFLREVNIMNTSHEHILFLFYKINYNGYVNSWEMYNVFKVSINRWKVFTEPFMNEFMVKV